MYNRNWLQEQIAGYLHDDSISETQLDVWIDMAAKRISAYLQCRQLESEITKAQGSPDSWLSLPQNFRRTLGVQWQHYGGQYVNLRSVSRSAAGNYKGTGQPCVYYIESNRIYPAPYTDANYKAQIMVEAIIPDGSAELDVLTAYPFIFLNAALVEAWDWKQDDVMVRRFEEKWRAEAQEVNALYQSERVGDTPAMRAM